MRHTAEKNATNRTTLYFSSLPLDEEGTLEGFWVAGVVLDEEMRVEVVVVELVGSDEDVDVVVVVVNPMRFSACGMARPTASSIPGQSSSIFSSR